MIPYIYRCPTRRKVQGFFADEVPPNKTETYEPVASALCTRVHLVNRSTGKNSARKATRFGSNCTIKAVADANRPTYVGIPKADCDQRPGRTMKRRDLSAQRIAGNLATSMATMPPTLRQRRFAFAVVVALLGKRTL
jgi:hypothetical protein